VWAAQSDLADELVRRERRDRDAALDDVHVARQRDVQLREWRAFDEDDLYAHTTGARLINHRSTKQRLSKREKERESERERASKRDREGASERA
jgi:hypothetical protein